MLKRIYGYFYEKPGRLTSVGRALAMVGASMLVAAAWAHFATTSINILPTLAGQPPASKMLADIYPTLSPWWIPESGWGFLAALLLIAAGLFANVHGRWIDRIYSIP